MQGFRWTKEVGLGFKTPKEAKVGTYVDKKCPFTGNVAIRGRILKGIVVSTKMTRTLIIRRDYLHWISKYKRCVPRACMAAVCLWVSSGRVILPACAANNNWRVYARADLMTLLHPTQRTYSFEKRHKNLAAHCSPAFPQIKEGDIVTVGQCRPLSKTVRFNVLQHEPAVNAALNVKKQFRVF